MSNPKHNTVILVPINNIELPSQQIDFKSGRGLDPTEKHTTLTIKTNQLLFTDMASVSIPKIVYRADFPHPASSMNDEKFQEAAGDYFYRALLVFRLLHRGIHIAPFYVINDGSPKSAPFISFFSYFIPFHKRHLSTKHWQITSELIPTLNEIDELVFRMDKDFLHLLTSFIQMPLRPLKDQAFFELIVVLEAIIVPDTKTELRHRFAERASVFHSAFDPSLNLEDAYSSFKLYYDLRSAIAHGNPSQRDKLMQENDLNWDKLIENLDNFCRAMILFFVRKPDLQIHKIRGTFMKKVILNALSGRSNELENDFVWIKKICEI